jgi:transcriptional regulator with XRE-family HTH domain
MDEDARKQFGIEIREMRGGKKWTQQQLADAAGVSKGTVRNLEKGRVELQPGNLGKVLDALGYKRAPEPWEEDEAFKGFLELVGRRVWFAEEAERDRMVSEITKIVLSRPKPPAART